jgi:hypothetical protein
VKFSVNGVHYEFDDERITFAEAKAIQKVTGKSMGEIRKDPEEISAFQAMIWVAMKRSDLTLRFVDLDDMSIGDIVFDDDEVAEEPAEGPDPTVPAAELELSGDSTPSG